MRLLYFLVVDLGDLLVLGFATHDHLWSCGRLLSRLSLLTSIRIKKGPWWSKMWDLARLSSMSSLRSCKQGKAVQPQERFNYSFSKSYKFDLLEQYITFMQYKIILDCHSLAKQWHFEICPLSYFGIIFQKSGLIHDLCWEVFCSYNTFKIQARGLKSIKRHNYFFWYNVLNSELIR